MDEFQKQVSLDLTEFFKHEFSNSREKTLRLSLESFDVAKNTLVEERIEHLLDAPYLKSVSKSYIEARAVSPLSPKDLVFEDIHNFQSFLSILKKSGFKISETGDSEKVFDDKSIPFRYNIYLISCVNVDFCSVLAENIVKFFPALDLISLFVFLSEHLEYQL